MRTWLYWVVLFLACLLVLAVVTDRASAYTITGPDQDGRYATIKHVLAEYPTVLAAIPASTEYRVASWSLNNSAKTTRQADGHLRVDLSGTLMNPTFSALVAHETAHVLELSRPGLATAWRQMETAEGFGSSTWRSYPQANWWRYAPSESWSENFLRALYWPAYSPWSTPRTYLGWYSRAEVKAFLAGQGVVVP